MSTFVDYGKPTTASQFQRYVPFLQTSVTGGDEGLDENKALIKR